MTNEMILRYLYYLTNMTSGSSEWVHCYEAWNHFGNFVGDEYEELLKKLKEFDKKYRINS